MVIICGSRVFEVNNSFRYRNAFFLIALQREHISQLFRASGAAVFHEGESRYTLLDVTETLLRQSITAGGASDSCHRSFRGRVFAADLARLFA
jgi:hypothetical protein